MRALIRKLLGPMLLGCISSSLNAQTWTQVTTGLPLGVQTTTGSSGSFSNYFQVTGIGPSGGSGSLFVGLGAGGVYRTDNHGASWTEANGGLKDTFSGRAMDALAFHKTGGAVLRFGTTASWNNHAGSAVFRSTDNGATWVESSPPVLASFVRVAEGDGRLYAGNQVSINAPQNSAGPYYSTDAGLTWNQWSSGLGVAQFAFSINRGLVQVQDRVLAAVATLGVYASTDGGVSYVPSDNGINLEGLLFHAQIDLTDMVVTPGGTVYLLTHGGSWLVYRSTDAGRTWTAINTAGMFGGNGDNSLWRLVVNGEDLVLAPARQTGVSHLWLYRPANGWYSLATDGFVGSDGEPKVAVHGGNVFFSTGGDLFRANLATVPLQETAPTKLTINGGGGLNVGVTRTLAASVDGTKPFSYQWYREGSLIAGATAATHTFTAASAADGGVFQLVAGNSAGSITNSVTVTVQGDAPGVRDYSFSPGYGHLGTFTYSYPAGVLLSVSGGGTDAILPLPDGRLLVGGGFTAIGNPPIAYGTPVSDLTPEILTLVNTFIRLNADGTLDRSFNPGAGPNGKVRALARQPDGRILAGGEFTSYAGQSVGRIVRLNPDGSVDPSFQAGSGAGAYLRSIIVQPDGKILVAGAFTSWDERGTAYLVRLNSDGSLDDNFRPDFVFNGEVASIALQPDGRILAGGSFSVGGAGYASLNRLNADGTLDQTFRPTTGIGSVTSVKLLADGRVVASGINNPYIRVYSSTGTPDNGFSANPGGQIYALGVLPGGEIVAVGDGRQILYSGTGTVVTNLAPRPIGTAPAYWAVASTPDGRFFIGDYAGSGGGGIAKFLGSPVAQAIMAGPRAIETTNGGSASFSVTVRGAGPFTYQWKKNGGNIGSATAATYAIPLVNASHVGNYSVEVTGPGGVMSSETAGLTLLGTPLILDPPRSQFVALNRPVTLGVRAVGVAPVSYQWKKGVSIILGATNASFTLGSMSLADVASYTVEVTALGTKDTSAAAVLTTGYLPGAVDRSFTAFYSAGGATVGAAVSDAAYQPDGKIVMASGRTSFNGRTGVRGVFRVNRDGSYDTTFAPTNNLESSAVAIQPDGKILLGLTKNATVAQLVRLLPDGKVDSSFANPLLSINGRIYHIVPLADGKVLVSGAFTSAAGMSRTNLARFHADGALDTSYGSAFPSGYAQALPDGRAIVAYRLFGMDYTRVLDREGTNQTTLGPLNSGGAITFGSAGGGQVLLLPDGKFLIADGNPFGLPNPARYLPSGTYDPTWKFHYSPGGNVSFGQQMLVQPDGRILFFGAFPGGLLTSTNPASFNLNRSIVRLTADGELDHTFDVFGGGSMTERALLLPDGRVFVAGFFTLWNGLPGQNLQILQGDLIEPSFYSPIPSLVLTQGNNLVLTPSPISRPGSATYQWRKNGQDIGGQTGPSLNLAAIGATGSGDYTLIARSPLGTNSTTTSVTVLGAPIITQQPVPPPVVVANPFTISVVVTGAPPFSFQWRKNGVNLGVASRIFTNASAALADSGNYDVVIGNGFGSVTSSVAVVTVITQPGSLSPDYSNTIGAPFHLIRQRDGKILFGRANGPARLNADGTADAAFIANAGTLAGGQAMALAPDGSLYHSANSVLNRYFPDGTRDTNFALANNFQSIAAVAVQADGRIVFGYSSTAMRRYWPDGAQDLSFSNNLAQVRTILTLDDGKLLIGTGNGYNSGAVRRLLADGSFDPSFDNASTFNNDVLSIEPLANGKLILGGAFTFYSSSSGSYSVQYVARLNANGSFDASFTGPSFSSVLYGVQDAAVQENGRIVVVGGFGTVNGLSRLGVARLEADGAHDATFNIGTGAGVSNIKLQSAIVQPDGRILVAGIFTTFNGVPRNGIALLNGDVVNLGFTRDPANQTLDVGDPLTLLSETTATTPVGYQWYRDSLVIPGATAASYSVAITTTNHRGAYFVVAANLSGLRTSLVAQVRILAAPVFLSRPAATNGYLNKLVTYAPVVEGRAPLSFQWLKDGSPLANAANATLTLPNLQFTHAGLYSLRVSNSLAVVTSSPVNLSVSILQGSVDLAFNASNHLSVAGTAAGLPDGRLYVAGNWSSNSVLYSRTVTRLRPDGSLDATFAVTNSALFQPPTIIQIDPQGRLLCVVGTAIYRLLPDGQVDPTWTGTSLGLNFGIASLAVQRDGKILVGGGFTVPQAGLLRLEPDGARDFDFKPGINDAVASVLALSDGSILAGTRYNPQIRLQRFRPDGSKFPGFTNVAFSGNSVDMTRLAELPDGRLLAGGSYTARLARFLNDGSVDPSFRSPTADTGIVADFAVEPGGKIVVAGSFNAWNGVPAAGLVRLSPDGEVDSTFIGGAAPPSGGSRVVIQYDGRIVLAGGFTGFDGAARSKIAGAYGTPVTLALTNPPMAGVFTVGSGATLTAGAWSATGASLAYQWRKNGLDVPGANGPALALNPLQQSDAGTYSVVVGDGAGSITSPGTPLTVLADPVFVNQPVSLVVTQGISATFKAVVQGAPPLAFQWRRNGVDLPGLTNSSLEIGATGTAAAGAYTLTASNTLGTATSQPAFLTVGTLPAGALDLSFHTNVVGGTVQTFDLDPVRNRILVGGDFTTWSNVTRSRFAILGSDRGELLSNNVTTVNSTVRVIGALPDGKVLLAGYFSALSDPVSGFVSRSGLGRLNADGSVDTAFTNLISAKAPSSPTVFSILPRPDGSAFVGGYFCTLGATVRTNFAKLTPGGFVDPSFGADNMTDNSVYAAAVDGDGKVVIVGAFTNVLGAARSRVARLNPNGTLDTTFTNELAVSSPYSTVSAVAIQPDGQILVGGTFTAAGGRPRNYLARLNRDGSLDSNFAPTLNTSVNSLAVLPDGRIVAGGDFTFVNGASSPRIVRLEPDGTTDPTFDAGGGFNGGVSRIELQDDGALVVCGAFTGYNGQTRYGLARLLGDGQLAPVIAAQPVAVSATTGATAQFGVAAGGLNPLRFQWRKAGANLAGQTNATIMLANLATNHAGGYSVVITNGFGSITSIVAGLSIQVVGGGGGGFLDWATAAGLTGANNAPGSDADNDGIPNALEYYFGSNPLNAASGLRPVSQVVSSGGQDYPAIQFLRRKSAPLVTPEIRVSSNVQFSDSLGSTTASAPDLGDGTELVTIRSNTSRAVQPVQFLQLRLTVP